MPKKKSVIKKEEAPPARWMLIAILLVTAIVFSNILRNEILYGWDDGEYIHDESVTQFRPDRFFSSYYLGMYQPLGVMTLSLNYQVSGDNPAPLHATNLLIHLVNVILVFKLLFMLTKRADITVAGALLFAIHPMHVEAVAWISTRSNGLYAAFFLAAIIFYLQYAGKGEKRKYFFSLGAFILALFSKSMAVTLPLILLLIDYHFEKRITRQRLVEKIPFFVLSVVFAVIAHNASAAFGHITNLQSDYNLADRFFLLCYSVTFYVIRAFVPVNLSAVYAFPAKTDQGFLPSEYYLSALFVAGLAVAIIWFLRKNKQWPAFGLLFFLLTISVTLPVVWNRMLMLADRYTYIPYIGIFITATTLIRESYDAKTSFLWKLKVPAAVVLTALLVWYAVASYQRTQVWKNAVTLTTDIIQKNRSDVDVSIGYFFRGNVRDRVRDLDGALSDFSKAIELNPAYTLAYNNRGIIYGEQEQFEEALHNFNKAIELEPEYRDAYYNRGNVKYYLGWRKEACLDWQKASALGSAQADMVRKKYCN